MKKSMMLIVAALMGAAWAGPDVMAFWPEGNSPELVRAKKVLAALADEGQLKDSDVRTALDQVRRQLKFATKGPVSGTIVSEEGRTFVQR